MALSGHLLSLATALPSPQCGHHKEHVRIPMRDGVTLMATHYSPRQTGASGGAFPTILIRSPYNRKSASILGRWFAGQMYHAIIQDTRGRCESEGEFDPMGMEEADGCDTVRWIRRQSWFQGCPLLGAWGPSFLGMVQWAGLSPDNPQDQPDALVPSMSSSQIHSILHPDGGVALGLGLRWHYLTYHIRAETSLTDMALMLASSMDRTCDKLFNLENFAESDAAITGKAGSTCLGRYLTQYVGTPADNPFWKQRDFRHKLHCAPPTHLIGGWYDFFLREVLADYTAMKEAGLNPFLTIGPWSHFDPGALFVGLEVGLQWFDNVLKGRTATARGSPTIRLRGVRAATSPSSNSTKVFPRSPTSTNTMSSNGSGSFESAMNFLSSHSGTSPSANSTPAYPQSPTSLTATSPNDEVPSPFPLESREPSLNPLEEADSAAAATANATASSMCHEAPPALFRLPVRLFVMGRNEWREFPAWPPPAVPTLFYLQEDQGLGQEVGTDGVTTYIYNPRHPTPSVGGTEFHPLRGGRKDMKPLQSRSDVVSFTSMPLTEDLEVIGPVRLTLYIRSSALTGSKVGSKKSAQSPEPFTDFVARLCLVSNRLGHKKTENVTDGYIRVQSGVGSEMGNGVLRLDIDMWATAQCWAAGQRLRLLICSAAHPRYQAPPISGKPVQQHILHGALYPSALILPVVSPNPPSADASHWYLPTSESWTSRHLHRLLHSKEESRGK